MSLDFNQNAFSVLEDFRRARRRAALQEIVSQLKGKSPGLLSYDDVVHKLKGQEVSMRELKDIPIDSIGGSVGRYKDFNRRFLPRNGIQADRWAKVKMAMTSLKGVPPIEVYQIGEVYFVKDGNHRVSVAREMGFSHFQAYVTKVRTKVPLTLNVEPNELIIKAEFADFLEQTRLDQLRPEADMTMTVPGQYEVLLEHIKVHRYYMGIDQRQEISFAEAVMHWYDTLYQPVIDIIRRRRLLREFSSRSETDLYIYITQHRAQLEEILGWEVSPETAAGDIEPRSSGYGPSKEWVRIASTPYEELARKRVEANDRIFTDILVLIDGTEGGWKSLAHAGLIAKREKGVRLHGLHVVATQSERQTIKADVLQSEFSERCRALNLTGQLAIDTGERIQTVCKRARYTDLTIVCLACPPVKASLGKGLSTLIRSCPRSVLVVSPVESSLDRVLLAYDGSELAREALHMATYLASRWEIELVVLTAQEDHIQAAKIQQRARQQLTSQGIEAVYVINTKNKVVDAIINTVEEQRSNLILMGAYGLNAPWYVKVGSAVAPVLQQSNQPVLICR